MATRDAIARAQEAAQRELNDKLEEIKAMLEQLLAQRAETEEAEKSDKTPAKSKRG